MAGKFDLAADRLLRSKHIRPARALIVGSKVYGEKGDRRKLYRLAFGIDLEDGPGVNLVHDMELPLPLTAGTFDHVDCCSVMEHCKRPWLMAENIDRVLEDGGTILLAVPFVWRIHGYPDDYWRFAPASLEVLFPRIEWVDRQLYSNGRVVKKTPSMNDAFGNRWMGRTELVAWGIKCNSNS